MTAHLLWYAAALVALVPSPSPGERVSGTLLPDPSGATAHSMSGRTYAAREFMRRELGDSHPGLHLSCAWIAGADGVLHVDGSTGDSQWSWELNDNSAALGGASSLGMLVEQFGPPIVVVEPERPASSVDQRACARVQAMLERAGLRAVDGAAARSMGRSIADEAVTRGMSPSLVTGILERPDGDYLLRVAQDVRTDSNGSAYGVPINHAQVALSLSLLRVCDGLCLGSSTVRAERRSHAAQAGLDAAEHEAATEASAHMAARVAQEWVDVSEGRRGWAIEWVGPVPHAPLPKGVDLASARVLEHRPGMRSLLEVSAAQAQRIFAHYSPQGLVHRRPGYMLIGRAEPGRGPLVNYVAIGALAASAICLGVWLLRSRARHASGRIGSI